MAETIPLASGAGAHGEYGRSLRLDTPTGPRDVARFLGAPSVVYDDDGRPVSGAADGG